MRLLLALMLSLTLWGQAPQTFTLPNGLEVILIEQHDRPLLRMKVRTAWPLAEAPLPAELALLTRLLAQPAPPGAAGELEDARAELRFEPGHQAFSWTAVAPSSEQEAALGLMAQQVFRTTPEPARVEQLRRGFRTEYREAPLELLARDRFLGLLGLPTPLFGEVEGALDRPNYESLLRLRKSLIRPERSRLILQGDISLEQARQLALLHFGTWYAEDPPGGRTAPVANPRLVACGQAARGLEVWVAIGGDPLDATLLQGLNRGLTRLWRKAPAPFEGVSVLEDGGGGLLLLRFAAPIRTGSLGALVRVQELLQELREKGLPDAAWQDALRESEALAGAEALHPGAWTRRLALEGGSGKALPRDASGFRAQLGRLLAPEGLRFMVLGAEPDARPALEGAGFKPLLWVNR